MCYVNSQTLRHKSNVNKVSQTIVRLHEFVVINKIMNLSKNFDFHKLRYAKTFRFDFENEIY